MDLSLLRDEAGAESKSDQSGDVVNFKAIHQLGPVVFHGFGTDFENKRDGFGGLSFGDELEDFTLPFRELLERSLLMGDLLEGKLLQQPIRDFAAEIDFAAGHAFHRRPQFRYGGFFEEITASAGFQCMPEIFLIFVPREYDDLHLGMV